MRGGIGEIGDPAFTVTADYSHAVALEHHPQDSRIKISENGTVQTLASNMGMGGNNVPLVMETQNSRPVNLTDPPRDNGNLRQLYTDRRWCEQYIVGEGL